MGGPTPPAGQVASSEGGQTYCLRWNNHQTNLVQILHALHEVGSYVDCTLVVDDEQFKAHRVVLAANSPYFQAILQDVPQDQCSIILPGVKGFEIAALLQYMYTGETTVTKSQEPEILRTAKELQVKGLYDNLMKYNHKELSEERSQSHQFQGSGHHHHHPHSHPHPHHHQPTSSSNGNTEPPASAFGQHNNSSSVISTSTHISPTSAAISSSCSPPPPPFGAAYQQSPYASFPPSASAVSHSHSHIPAVEAPLTPTHSHTPSGESAAGAAPGQWPLSPSASAAAAAAMLNSVYESAADMNPLKRKKLSAISSMLLNTTRDTPILRNVLAQANPADSSQPNPLMLPGVKSAVGEKTPTHQQQHHQAHPHQLGGSGSGSAVGAGSHSFNGSDYGGDKEPLSPHTDRSFDEDLAGSGGGQGSGKKPEWKRYKQYTRTDMMCAIQCVREGMSALQASRKFGLPSRTLYDKVRKLNINTGRGTHRGISKRSPPAKSSAAFRYSAAAAAAAHNYGQTELEHDQKEHPAAGHGLHGHHGHGMTPTIPHSAAALLDHAFLQQALENRGGDIAGREALHAMALAAAAHAAANRMSNSPPDANGHVQPPARSPLHHHRHYAEQEQDQDQDHEMELEEKHGQALIKREAIEEERDADDDDDHDQVEDLSLQRKERPESPYSPPPPRAASPMESASVIMHSTNTNSGAAASVSTNGKEAHELEREHELEDYQAVISPSAAGLGLGVGMKRELLGSDEAQARTD